MKILDKLSQKPTFTIEDIRFYLDNSKSAYSLLYRYLKANKVIKIKNNLYSVYNPVTQKVIANRYQIACAIHQGAYITHVSALEYYGLTLQLRNIVYVASPKRFRSFEFDSIYYVYQKHRFVDGVIPVENMSEVRVSTLERTLVDIIHDFNKYISLDEFIYALNGMELLDFRKVKQYLILYHQQATYQRLGFLLSTVASQIGVSSEFISFCKKEIKESRRYLNPDKKGQSVYDPEWGLMIPINSVEFDDQGLSIGESI